MYETAASLPALGSRLGEHWRDAEIRMLALPALRELQQVKVLAPPRTHLDRQRPRDSAVQKISMSPPAFSDPKKRRKVSER